MYPEHLIVEKASSTCLGWGLVKWSRRRLSVGFLYREVPIKTRVSRKATESGGVVHSEPYRRVGIVGVLMHPLETFFSVVLDLKKDAIDESGVKVRLKFLSLE